MKPNRYMIFASLGMELVGLILGCLYVGQALDNLWHTTGLMVVFFVVAGLASWMIHLVFLLKRMEKLDENQD